MVFDANESDDDGKKEGLYPDRKRSHYRSVVGRVRRTSLERRDAEKTKADERERRDVKVQPGVGEAQRVRMTGKRERQSNHWKDKVNGWREYKKIEEEQNENRWDGKRRNTGCCPREEEETLRSVYSPRFRVRVR